jgi:hypothetical protein
MSFTFVLSCSHHDDEWTVGCRVETHKLACLSGEGIATSLSVQQALVCRTFPAVWSTRERVRPGCRHQALRYPIVDVAEPAAERTGIEFDGRPQ